MENIIYCKLLEALNIKGLYNKYDEWLDKKQQSAIIQIIHIKLERETPRGNQAELMKKAMQSMGAMFFRDDEEPLPDEKERVEKNIDELMDTDPTIFYLLVTYKRVATRS